MLVSAIRSYDQQHSSILKDRATGQRPAPLEMLKYLMAEHTLNNAGLARLLDIGSGHASLILAGKRGLSKANIRILAEHFSVNPSVFL